MLKANYVRDWFRVFVNADSDGLLSKTGCSAQHC